MNMNCCICSCYTVMIVYQVPATRIRSPGDPVLAVDRLVACCVTIVMSACVYIKECHSNVVSCINDICHMFVLIQLCNSHHLL